VEVLRVYSVVRTEHWISGWLGIGLLSVQSRGAVLDNMVHSTCVQLAYIRD